MPVLNALAGGHRFTACFARDVRLCVPGEELHVLPGLVCPDRDLADTDPPRGVHCEGVVELFRADRLRGATWELEYEIVDATGRRGDVRVVPGAERARTGAEVLGGRANGQSVGAERILDAEPQRERIARLRVQHVLHHDARSVLLGRPPGRPADEAVNRVARRRLGQRELICRAVELVRPVRNPVRPGCEHVAASGLAHFIERVAVENAVVAAQPAAGLDHDGPLVAVFELARAPEGAITTCGRRARRRFPAAPTCPRRSLRAGRARDPQPRLRAGGRRRRRA